METITGTVVAGYRKARAVGFPTANISLATKPTVAEGTYAGYAQIGDDSRSIPALVFYGTPHMIPDVTKPRCEAHLLEDAGDLYGKRLSIELVAFLRPNEHFLSEDALAAAIKHDFESVKKYFASQPLTSNL